MKMPRCHCCKDMGMGCTVGTSALNLVVNVHCLGTKSACAQWPCKLSLLRKPNPGSPHEIHQAGFFLHPQTAIMSSPSCPRHHVQRHHVLHSHGNGFRLAHEPFLDVNGDRTCSAKSKACNPVKTLARWHDNLRRQCACMATCAVMSGNLPASMPLPVACSCSSSAPGGIQELCAHACLMHEHTGERWSLYCAGAVRMGTFHAHEGSFMGLLHWVCFASPSGSSVVTAPL